MKDPIQVNRVLKWLNDTKFFSENVFFAKKTKRLGDWVIEAYETEKNGEDKITLIHHKKAQAIATVFDIGLMICVDVNHKPYYYFY